MKNNWIILALIVLLVFLMLGQGEQVCCRWTSATFPPTPVRFEFISENQCTCDVILGGGCGQIVDNSYCQETNPALVECYNSGGTWASFSNGCVDSCEKARNPSILCTQAFTDGCDCGPDKCWNFDTKQCELN